MVFSRPSFSKPFSKSWVDFRGLTGTSGDGVNGRKRRDLKVLPRKSNSCALLRLGYWQTSIPGASTKNVVRNGVGYPFSNWFSKATYVPVRPQAASSSPIAAARLDGERCMYRMVVAMFAWPASV